MAAQKRAMMLVLVVVVVMVAMLQTVHGMAVTPASSAKPEGDDFKILPVPDPEGGPFGFPYFGHGPQMGGN